MPRLVIGQEKTGSHVVASWCEASGPPCCCLSVCVAGVGRKWPGDLQLAAGNPRQTLNKLKAGERGSQEVDGDPNRLHGQTRQPARRDDL